MNEQRIDRLMDKTGGPFCFTALVQKRMIELYRGALPMAPVKKHLMDTVLDEIEVDKISLKPPSAAELPEPSVADDQAAAEPASAEE